MSNDLKITEKKPRVEKINGMLKDISVNKDYDTEKTVVGIEISMYIELCCLTGTFTPSYKFTIYKVLKVLRKYKKDLKPSLQKKIDAHYKKLYLLRKKYRGDFNKSKSRIDKEILKTITTSLAFLTLKYEIYFSKFNDLVAKMLNLFNIEDRLTGDRFRVIKNEYKASTYVECYALIRVLEIQSIVKKLEMINNNKDLHKICTFRGYTYNDIKNVITYLYTTLNHKNLL